MRRVRVLLHLTANAVLHRSRRLLLLGMSIGVVRVVLALILSLVALVERVRLLLYMALVV